MQNDIITNNRTLAHERGMTDASRDFKSNDHKTIAELEAIENKATGYTEGYKRAYSLLAKEQQVKGWTNGKA